MTSALVARRVASVPIGLVLALLAGCGAFLPAVKPQPAYYGFDTAAPEVAATARSQLAERRHAPTLEIDSPIATAGFDSTHIVYLRTPLEPEYFAHSQWMDTPAHMLAPLVMSTIAASGAFGAVIHSPSAAVADLWLGTEIVRLQQVFAGAHSHVQFSLRVYLVDNATRRVLLSRELDATVPSTTEDPYGGVVAANAAVRAVLGDLVSLCRESAATWQGAAPRDGVRRTAAPAPH